VAWALLTAFSQNWSENFEQNAEQGSFLNLQFAQRKAQRRV
jgi:hypothetical protein